MWSERVITAIENAKVLDRPADATAAAVNSVLPAGSVKDALSGTWLGHGVGVGVDTTAFQSGPSDWTDVAAEADLVDGGPFGSHAAEVPLLLRRGEQLYVLNDRCTHRGAPLHEGSVVDDCIECPWHGSRFGLADGDVVRGPATRPQPTFEVRAAEGRIWVRREQRALRANPVGAGSQSS